jgi:hypothetical protein
MSRGVQFLVFARPPIPAAARSGGENRAGLQLDDIDDMPKEMLPDFPLEDDEFIVFTI